MGNSDWISNFRTFMNTNNHLISHQQHNCHQQHNLGGIPQTYVCQKICSYFPFSAIAFYLLLRSSRAMGNQNDKNDVGVGNGAQFWWSFM